MAGAPTNPSWYYNLKAHPEVTVEVGTERFATTATELAGDERDSLWEVQKAEVPQFAEYEEKAKRTIALIALTRA